MGTPTYSSQLITNIKKLIYFFLSINCILFYSKVLNAEGSGYKVSQRNLSTIAFSAVILVSSNLSLLSNTDELCVPTLNQKSRV